MLLEIFIIKYGNDALEAISKNIDPDLIKKLDDFGVKPSDYDNFRIIGRESAETVAEAAAEVEKFAYLLKTEKNIAFFWSGKTNGIGVADRALEIARERGGTTIEKIIETKGINMPEWNINDAKSVEIWRQASLKYAQQASGEVWAVIGSSVREDSIWLQYELPALTNNINVTKITVIDPETLVETVIFTR
ncbi:hypothetical protein [Acetivibrio saccincola]|uniref:Uncharacterized protein n=1 Tax=Acetivibrio saccincola TaxID=1677857 RepID=A0A2K9E1D1_9FIRM|nr:hypothetical protein [Acetivibrio saccincola]AUG56168.1 hypothetical protein HVS_00980 [Acetivibrio saccincola]